MTTPVRRAASRLTCHDLRVLGPLENLQLLPLPPTASPTITPRVHDARRSIQVHVQYRNALHNFVATLYIIESVGVYLSSGADSGAHAGTGATSDRCASLRATCTGCSGLLASLLHSVSRHTLNPRLLHVEARERNSPSLVVGFLCRCPVRESPRVGCS